jgi:hypothetical protein
VSTLTGEYIGLEEVGDGLWDVQLADRSAELEQGTAWITLGVLAQDSRNWAGGFAASMPCTHERRRDVPARAIGNLFGPKVLPMSPERTPSV